MLPGRLRGGALSLVGLADDLANHGVVLVVEAGLQGSKLDGATLFTDDGVAVVGLTARYDRFDVFVSRCCTNSRTSYCGTSLPVQARFSTRVSRREPSKASAARYGVHSSLVIGRLQRDGVLDWGRLRNHIPKVRPYLGGAGR